jgi:hypothetical protein
MATGCVPIVYKDGGAWYDIVSKITDFLGYTDITEIPNIIKKVEEDKELYIKLKKICIEFSKRFSYENFKKALLSEIEKVIGVTSDQ